MSNDVEVSFIPQQHALRQPLAHERLRLGALRDGHNEETCGGAACAGQAAAWCKKKDGGSQQRRWHRLSSVHARREACREGTASAEQSASDESVQQKRSEGRGLLQALPSAQVVLLRRDEAQDALVEKPADMDARCAGGRTRGSRQQRKRQLGKQLRATRQQARRLARATMTLQNAAAMKKGVKHRERAAACAAEGTRQSPDLQGTRSRAAPRTS